MEYKTLLEEITYSNVIDTIAARINELLIKGYEFIDLSFFGTQRVILIFRKI